MSNRYMQLSASILLTTSLRLCAFLLLTSSAASAQTQGLPLANPDDLLRGADPDYWSIGVFAPRILNKNKILSGESQTLHIVLLDLGYKSKSLTFDSPVVVSDSAGIGRVTFDRDPSHAYSKKPCIRGSYLSLSAEYVALSLRVFDKRLIFLSTGPCFDFRIGSKYRSAYKVNEQKIKRSESGNDLLQLSNVNVGWRASLRTYGFGVFYEYSFSPFFQKDWGVKYRFHSLGLLFEI